MEFNSKLISLYKGEMDNYASVPIADSNQSGFAKVIDTILAINFQKSKHNIHYMHSLFSFLAEIPNNNMIIYSVNTFFCSHPAKDRASCIYITSLFLYEYYIYLSSISTDVIEKNYLLIRSLNSLKWHFKSKYYYLNESESKDTYHKVMEIIDDLINQINICKSITSIEPETLYDINEYIDQKDKAHYNMINICFIFEKTCSIRNETDSEYLDYLKLFCFLTEINMVIVMILNINKNSNYSLSEKVGQYTIINSNYCNIFTRFNDYIEKYLTELNLLNEKIVHNYKLFTVVMNNLLNYDMEKLQYVHLERDCLKLPKPFIKEILYYYFN